MTSKTFVFTTLGLAAALSALVAFVNWRIDYYGLYGRTVGEPHIVVSNERWTKYLYSLRYIPENFDALLIGSSVSANTDASAIPGVKTYNLSMSGANISEELRMLEEALARGRFQQVLFCVTPYLVKDHGLKAGGMESRDYWSGFGSLPLFEDYIAAFAIRAGLTPPRFDAFGRQNLELAGTHAQDPDDAVRTDLAKADAARPDKIDPVAETELRMAIRAARNAGARVIAYFPPIYGPRYRARAAQFSRFEKRMRAVFAPEDAILDFNDGSFTAFSENAENFLDGVHYTHAGAAKLSEALTQRLAADSRTR